MKNGCSSFYLEMFLEIIINMNGFDILFPAGYLDLVKFPKQVKQGVIVKISWSKARQIDIW